MAAHNENLALFYRPTIDKSEGEKEWIEYRPSGPLNSDGALEFNIPANVNKYIDLSNTRIKIKCKLLLADGKNLPSQDVVEGKGVPDNAKVGPVNLFLHSLWRQVDLSLQQQIISPEVATRYPYKAYFETVLGFGDDAKQSQLGAQMYYKDVGDVGDADAVTGTNSGLLTRAEFLEESAVVDMEGPVYADLCQQNRYLMNGIQVGFKFWPSTSEFRLMSSNPSPKYKVEIVEAVLKICMRDVSKEIREAHRETIRRGPALYFYDRTDVKAYAMAKGQYGTTIEDMYQGAVPHRLIVGMVESAGFNGDFKSNPYHFQDFNCSFIGFYVEGKSVPSAALTPNYKTGNYMSAYTTLFGNQHMMNFGNTISREEYPKGYCFYVFDLCEKRCEKYAEPLKRGHTRLEIKMSEALKKPVTIIVYATFPGLMEVDENRNIRVM